MHRRASAAPLKPMFHSSREFFSITQLLSVQVLPTLRPNDTALAPTDTWNHPPTLHGYVHGVAAQSAFLCTATAMLLQAWRLRGDTRWRCWFRPAFAYAALCFVLLWVQAFWRTLPRGLSQKALIVLMLGWLIAAAWRLLRGPDRAGVRA